MKRLLLSIALAVLSLVACAANPKNIILFIGDGMSTPQRMTADEFARKTGKPDLAMNRLKHQATTRTCSADSLVTDSAAAATAIACGEKTNNHYLGVDAQGKRLTSCAEAAHKAGKKVGIVTTVTINHATPGGFYAHRKDRGENYAIGLDLLDSGFEFFAGGGLPGHNEKNNKLYKGDIYELAKSGGYEFIREDREKFLALKPSGKRVWYVGASRELPYAIDAEAWSNIPTLAEMTAQGIRHLENKKGFFLMVEGGKIDYAGHANDPAANLRDLLALDDAVRVALAYRKKHPETLVIVTGDHETGGMTMGLAGTGYAFYMDRLANQTCSADAIKDIVNREKPADFEALKPILTRAFGFAFDGQGPMALSSHDQSVLEQAFNHDCELARKGQKDDARYDAAKITHLPTTLKHIMSKKCGIGWTSGSHTALPVLTTAEGPGAERFTGFIDNTDISKIIKDFVKK